MARFRLMRGRHQQADVLLDENGEPVLNEDGTVRKVSVTYDSRDPNRNIVESDIDLEKLFGSEKFQNLDRISAGNDDLRALKDKLERLERENKRLRARQGEERDVDLSKMTISELRDFAAKHNIELDPGMKKDEIINAIQFDLETGGDEDDGEDDGGE